MGTNFHSTAVQSELLALHEEGIKEEGLITDEDFARLKADILSRVAARAGAGAGAIQRTDVVSERLFQARGPFAHIVKVVLP